MKYFLHLKNFNLKVFCHLISLNYFYNLKNKRNFKFHWFFLQTIIIIFLHKNIIYRKKQYHYRNLQLEYYTIKQYIFFINYYISSIMKYIHLTLEISIYNIFLMKNNYFSL